MTALTLFLIALGAASLGFAVLFFVARMLDNYGIVDVAWAAGFTPVAIWYSLAGDGVAWRRLVVAGLVAGWSLRLTWHLGQRVARMHPEEDGRYQQLRRDWAGAQGRRMFWFFQGQAVVLALLSWPFLVAARNSAPSPGGLEYAGLLLWAIAVAGESLSDAQLEAFKRVSTNRGRVCDRGLWRYSRHPNYFFEWLAWVAFAVFALPAPGGWLALGCPAFMLFLLLRVTGIRYTEEQLVRSKGEAYEAYRARTPAFVPWFPRPAATPKCL